MKVSSPCTKVCFIDPSTGLCEGCYRSLEEIGLWSSYSLEKREEILSDLNLRKKSMKLELT
ncbi:DUF1289 domain-containing protein [Leptospira sp. GIMC2001]|uniref:DUF1289 domain-containing protein n=1 Tax=Leptospira sp. GIMC2001 TaxID=1513297 RepID=UPI002349D980|nr:DUF1289 domain-containing protein [Leptospira sp. GIMC2001]WCL48951.1 DUF1289 domain-containing protein [Leptospira sp. GIMC2001]